MCACIAETEWYKRDGERGEEMGWGGEREEMGWGERRWGEERGDGVGREYSFISLPKLT